MLVNSNGNFKKKSPRIRVFAHIKEIKQLSWEITFKAAFDFASVTTLLIAATRNLSNPS